MLQKRRFASPPKSQLCHLSVPGRGVMSDTWRVDRARVSRLPCTLLRTRSPCLMCPPNWLLSRPQTCLRNGAGVWGGCSGRSTVSAPQKWQGDSILPLRGNMPLVRTYPSMECSPSPWLAVLCILRFECACTYRCIQPYPTLLLSTTWQRWVLVGPPLGLSCGPVLGALLLFWRCPSCLGACFSPARQRKTSPLLQNLPYHRIRPCMSWSPAGVASKTPGTTF